MCPSPPRIITNPQKQQKFTWRNLRSTPRQGDRRWGTLQPHPSRCRPHPNLTATSTTQELRRGGARDEVERWRGGGKTGRSWLRGGEVERADLSPKTKLLYITSGNQGITAGRTQCALRQGERRALVSGVGGPDRPQIQEARVGTRARPGGRTSSMFTERLINNRGGVMRTQGMVGLKMKRERQMEMSNGLLTTARTGRKNLLPEKGRRRKSRRRR